MVSASAQLGGGLWCCEREGAAVAYEDPQDVQAAPGESDDRPLWPLLSARSRYPFVRLLRERTRTLLVVAELGTTSHRREGSRRDDTIKRPAGAVLLLAAVLAAAADPPGGPAARHEDRAAAP